MTTTDSHSMGRRAGGQQADLPPDPALREHVIRNQTMTAMEWSETTPDMTVNDMVNRREAVRTTRWQLLVLAVVVLLLAAYGAFWTLSTFSQSRALAANSAAASASPYAPQTLTPVR